MNLLWWIRVPGPSSCASFLQGFSGGIGVPRSHTCLDRYPGLVGRDMAATGPGGPSMCIRYSYGANPRTILPFKPKSIYQVGVWYRFGAWIWNTHPMPVGGLPNHASQSWIWILRHPPGGLPNHASQSWIWILRHPPGGLPNHASQIWVWILYHSEHGVGRMVSGTKV